VLRKKGKKNQGMSYYPSKYYDGTRHGSSRGNENYEVYGRKYDPERRSYYSDESSQDDTSPLSSYHRRIPESLQVSWIGNKEEVVLRCCEMTRRGYKDDENVALEERKVRFLYDRAVYEMEKYDTLLKFLEERILYLRSHI
jgi:hypothetical protein